MDPVQQKILPERIMLITLAGFIIFIIYKSFKLSSNGKK